MFESDVSYALALLRGYSSKNRYGLLTTEYLQEGSVEERKAREALTRILRSGSLPTQLCYALADLFDPDPDPFKSIDVEGSDPSNGYVNTKVIHANRKLAFKFRKANRQRDHVRDTALARAVLDAVKAGQNVENAIAETATRYGLEESTVGKIWRRYRRTFFIPLGELRADGRK